MWHVTSRLRCHQDVHILEGGTYLPEGTGTQRDALPSCPQDCVNVFSGGETARVEWAGRLSRREGAPPQ